MRTAALLPLLLLAASCAVSAEKRPTYAQMTAYDGGVKLGGCVVGNLDPESVGDEIGVTAGDGSVLCLRYDGETWHAETVAGEGGEKIQCAAGDLDPTSPGDELVVVGVVKGGEDDGGAGVAIVHRRGPEGWSAEELASDGQLLHAVCIGELDPAHEGLEVLVGGISGRVQVLGWQPGGWASLGEVTLPGAAKGAAAADGVAYVACADGAVVQVGKTATGWGTETLGTVDAPLARIASQGGRVLYSANDGNLRLAEQVVGIQDGETTWHSYVVHHSTDRLRGAVFTDLTTDGEHSWASAGYDGNIVVIEPEVVSQESVPFTATVVGTDTDKFHHLAGGRIAGLGPVLVGCSYSGRVTVVHRTQAE